MPKRIDPLFDVHMLNDDGKQRARAIAENFTDMLACLQAAVGPVGAGSREFSIVKTKLQEASFWAKRSMAMQPEFQQPCE